ncbi:MAG: cupin domain-containing protein [Gallionella sp.]|nr:cupin domain-containing protein [Gallionella sp.]
MYAVNFDELPWESPMPGAQFKSFARDGKKLRIAEFTREFVEPHWCEKGHAGIVLSGELEIDFNGKVVRYLEGAAILIPAGAEHVHKGRAITPVVRLFLVEGV